MNFWKCIEKRCSTEELEEVYDYEFSFTVSWNTTFSLFDDNFSKQLRTMDTAINERSIAGEIAFLYIRPIYAGTTQESVSSTIENTECKNVLES